MNLMLSLFYTGAFARVVQEAFNVKQADTMNHPVGGYRIANSENEAKFRGDYFEVTTETMQFDYGEVFWKHLAPIPFPKDVIAKLKKTSNWLNPTPTIHITGFELDIMRKNPWTGEEETVPQYEVYNHHCVLYMRGQTKLGQIPQFVPTSAEEKMKGHGGALKLEELDVGLEESVTLNAFLGSEMRGTYYYLSEGYAMRLDNPQDMTLEAMLINVGKPGGGRCNFPGDSDVCPLPKKSQAPLDATYSGLLECPCTERLPTVINQHKIATGARCKLPIKTKDECFAAAKEFGLTAAKNITSMNPLEPPGCSLKTAPMNLFDMFTDKKWNYEAHTTVTWNENPLAVGSCLQPSAYLYAEANTLVEGSSMHVVYNVVALQSRLTMTGPADLWFAYGFGKATMNGAIAFIAEGDDTFQARTLGDHEPGTQIKDDGIFYTVVSNKVVDGARTVIVDINTKHFLMNGVLNPGSTLSTGVIGAVGASAKFGYHKAHGSERTSFLNLGTNNCVCENDPDHPTGSIGGVDYSPDCASQLKREKCATCDIRAYTGGLKCCTDGALLLDPEQQQPKNSTQNPYIKLRVYYENGHDNMWNKDSAFEYYPPEGIQTEYDITKGLCSFKMADGTCVHEFNETKMAVEAYPLSFVTGGDAELVMIQGHCHGPHCISQEIWNADTGELLCKTGMTYGTELGEPGNEEGYVIGSSTCVFGHEKGLKKPPRVSPFTKLHTRKLANATYGHLGDMAGWVTVWTHAVLAEES